MLWYSTDWNVVYKKTNYFYREVENLRPIICEWFSFEQIKRIDSSLLQSDPVTFSQGTFITFGLSVSGNLKGKKNHTQKN